MHRTETTFDGDEVISVITHDVSWSTVRAAEQLEMQLSSSVTGALERTSSCRQHGVTFAKLYETYLRIMQRPTTPPTHFRHVLLSDGDDQEKTSAGNRVPHQSPRQTVRAA